MRKEEKRWSEYIYLGLSTYEMSECAILQIYSLRERFQAIVNKILSGQKENEVCIKEEELKKWEESFIKNSKLLESINNLNLSDSVKEYRESRLKALKLFPITCKNYQKAIKKFSEIEDSKKRIKKLYYFFIEVSKEHIRGHANFAYLGCNDERSPIFRRYRLINETLRKYFNEAESIKIIHSICNPPLPTWGMDVSKNLLNFLNKLGSEREERKLEAVKKNLSKDSVVKDLYILAHKFFNGNYNLLFKTLAEYDSIDVKEALLRIDRNEKKKEENKRKVLRRLKRTLGRKDFSRLSKILYEIQELMYINEYIDEKLFSIIEQHPLYWYYKLCQLLITTLNELGERVTIREATFNLLDDLSQKYL